MRKKKSFYEAVSKKIGQEKVTPTSSPTLSLGSTVRRLREQRKLLGVELCRRTSDLNSKTLTALEKGRIRNPSIKTLQSVARGLNMTVSALFREAEMMDPSTFYQGSQKGFFQIDFPRWGVRVISFTPPVKDFFCGKLIVGARKTIGDTMNNQFLSIYVSVLIGRLEVDVEGKKTSMKEGDNLFFKGILKHSFTNPTQRDAVGLIVTVPSFL